MHKGSNLFKEMGIILPNGMIFDFLGPFFSDGDHNDEWMWSYIVDTNCGNICDVFKLETDEFLADRGFIRVKDKEGMFFLRTPVGLSPKQKQLSVQDANQSRLVTRFRNIVERVFGRMKARWKILDDTIDSGLWPVLHPVLRLLAAVENAFFPPLWTDKESDNNDAMMIEQRVKLMTNEMQKIFEDETGKNWQKIDYEQIIQKTPKLSPEDLRKWSVGPYALTLAKPYLEHSSDLKFWQHKKLSSVYKAKGMLSRFVTSDNTKAKKYTVVVKIPSTGNVTDILSYCTCKAGARTLGGCAHSCAILYHLTIGSDRGSLNKANTAKKRVLSSGAIDLKSYKIQKMKESKDESPDVIDDSQLLDIIADSPE